MNEAPKTNTHEQGSDIGETLREQTYQEFAQAMEDYRNNPVMHDLITNLAGDLIAATKATEEQRKPSEDSDTDSKDTTEPSLKEGDYELASDVFENEDAFMGAAQKVLDFRKGKSREELENVTLSTPTLKALREMKDTLGMNRETEPEHKEVEVMFIPGAAGKVPAARLDYGVELLENENLTTGAIVMIGCERPINMKLDKNGKTEIDRAGAAGYSKSGVMAKTEFDLMRNTAAHKFDIEDSDWKITEGDDPDVPKDENNFESHYRIAHATTKDGQLVAVVSAPMISEDRLHPDGNPRIRANTIDGYIMTAEMLDDYFDHLPDDVPRRAVTITDAVFTPFQGVDAEGALAPFGIESETVGFTREHAGMPEWPGGDAYYLQEIFSTLWSLRAGRDRLEATSERKHATQLSQ